MPTMSEQEVHDNIKMFDMKERLKLLLSVSCFCMQLEYVGAGFTNSEVERRQTELGLCLAGTMAMQVRKALGLKFSKPRFKKSITNLARMWATLRAAMEVMGSIDRGSAGYSEKEENETSREWYQRMACATLNDKQSLADICKDMLERTCVLPIDIVTVTSMFFDGNSENDFIECSLKFIDWDRNITVHEDIKYLSFKEGDFDYAFRQEMCNKRTVVEGEIESIMQALYARGTLVDKEGTGSYKKLYKSMIRFSDVSKRMRKCHPDEFRKLSYRIQKRLQTNRTTGPFVSVEKADLKNIIGYLKKKDPHPWMQDGHFCSNTPHSTEALGKVTVHVDSVLARFLFIQRQMLKDAQPSQITICTDPGMECYIEIPSLRQLDEDAISELYKVRVRWIYGDEDDIGDQSDLTGLFDDEDDEMMSDGYESFEDDDCDDREAGTSSTSRKKDERTFGGLTVFETFVVIHCSVVLLGTNISHKVRDSLLHHCGSFERERDFFIVYKRQFPQLFAQLSAMDPEDFKIPSHWGRNSHDPIMLSPMNGDNEGRRFVHVACISELREIVENKRSESEQFVRKCLCKDMTSSQGVVYFQKDSFPSIELFDVGKFKAIYEQTEFNSKRHRKEYFTECTLEKKRQHSDGENHDVKRFEEFFPFHEQLRFAIQKAKAMGKEDQSASQKCNDTESYNIVYWNAIRELSKMVDERYVQFGSPSDTVKVNVTELSCVRDNKKKSALNRQIPTGSNKKDKKQTTT